MVCRDLGRQEEEPQPRQWPDKESKGEVGVEKTSQKEPPLVLERLKVREGIGTFRLGRFTYCNLTIIRFD